MTVGHLKAYTAALFALMHWMPALPAGRPVKTRANDPKHRDGLADDLSTSKLSISIDSDAKCIVQVDVMNDES